MLKVVMYSSENIHSHALRVFGNSGPDAGGGWWGEGR